MFMDYHDIPEKERKKLVKDLWKAGYSKKFTVKTPSKNKIEIELLDWDENKEFEK